MRCLVICWNTSSSCQHYVTYIMKLGCSLDWEQMVLVWCRKNP